MPKPMGDPGAADPTRMERPMSKPLSSNEAEYLLVRNDRPGSGSGLGILLLLLALVFISGPFLLQMVGVKMPAESLVVFVVFGAALFLMAAVSIIFTRLYHRAPADMAFVRTGMGGPKVVLDGGALVIPVVHEVVWVSLRTMRLEVTRSAQDALITRNYLRADVTAEFFIKVPKEKGAVMDAATSLGRAAIDPRGVERVLDKKLESALRQVAAEMDLTELLVNRADFIKKVSDHVGSDIKNNGLVLESVTISRLDQTPAGALRPEENIFDAQAARNITEITTAQNVERNKLNLGAQRQIEQEKVGTDKFLYEQQVARETAAADRDRQIKIAQASAHQESTSKAAELERQARLAEVARDQAVQLAQVSQAQAVDVAGQAREQAVKQAEIAKAQAVEVANRDREIAVAQREQALAKTRASQLEAEAEKARREQDVATVQVTATAEREKQKAIIAAEADAGRRRVEQQTAADVDAYATVKQAEALKQAAEQEASARLMAAEADQKAKAMSAEGEKAIQMVPVAVAQAQVEVERAKVGVQRESLSNQSQFESIAKELQVELAKIAAERDVQIEAAKAMGVAFSTAHITIWGDPSSVAKMTEAFYRGQQWGQLANGFSQSVPPEAKEMFEGLATVIRDKLGLPISAEQLKGLVEQSQSKS